MQILIYHSSHDRKYCIICPCNSINSICTMLKQTLFVFLNIGIISMVGCSAYSPPRTYHVMRSKEYKITFEEAWSRMVRWFALSRISIKNMDKESGFISSEHNMNTGDTLYCDCGSTKMTATSDASISDITTYMNVLLEKVDSSRTRITVTTKFDATINQWVLNRYQGGVRRECNSKGKLESEIHNLFSN